jgi:hypothetical protein
MSSQAYIEAMLCIYEMNDVSYLKALFIRSYERSVQEYRAVRQSLGDPDAFRSEYRANIFSVVQQVLLEGLNRLQALEYLQAYSKEKIKALDQEQFCVVVETELLALHEGNFARYRVRPSEFEAWQRVWQ